MSTVQEIEKAIRQLTANEFAALRDWVAQYDAEAWDRQLEEDAVAGRLDELAKEAIANHRDGRCTEL